MISWLRKKGAVCNETTSKRDLYQLILPLTPKEIYKTDAMLANHGHTVVRLSPYTCDLKPTGQN
ncbi:hypothetical protein Cfor_08032 [Coptotermes formosanus]|jgi:transposase|uniref:Uncharacterized protein n=1 Tax=Coptotermes formosanus TaxID=36987 RepID=A0A6L2Q2G6_COPFO|nr:hypothetical protein Cfor_08032 [Coptotermes formosanus]